MYTLSKQGVVKIVAINSRCAQILIWLLNANEPVKIQDFSEKFKVSERTIRYDLDLVEEFLRHHSLQPLSRKPRSGIMLVESPEGKQRLAGLLKEVDVDQIILSSEERATFTLSELISQQGYVTIQSIADKLSVSRNTVFKDLEKIRTWLRKYNLAIESLPRHGIKLIGEERSLRRLQSELLAENDSIVKSFAEMESNPRKTIKISDSLRNFFKDLDLQYIEECITIAEEELETVFSDEAFAGLAIHIAIALKRIQLGKDILMNKDELKALDMTREFAVASNIAKMLEERFKTLIPIDEIGYITIHLLGSTHSSSKDTESENWVELQILTTELIQEVSLKIGTDLTMDSQLFKNLIEHLKPAIYRLTHDLTLKNPLLDELKLTYQELFDVVKRGLQPVEDYTQKILSDEEVGYFTMHFAAALERQKYKTTIKQNVLVVCATGIGTAEMLSSRIKSVFDVNIVGTVPSRQVKTILQEKKVDLIITSVPISVVGVTCVEVNPLLTEEDIEKLNRYIKRQGRAEPAIEMEDILQTVKKHCQIVDYEGLVNDLAKILTGKKIGDKKGVYQPVLRDLLTAKTIKLQVAADTWEDAVRGGGELLENDGCIEHEYIEAMINSVKEIGPYIVIAPGIAMPHARPEAGVKKIGMSLITLSTPVNFGNKENDPVDIVISFCAVDHSTHIKALSELVGLLSDDERLKTIRSATNASDVQKLISDFDSKKH